MQLTSTEKGRRRRGPSGLALVGVGSLVGSVVAFEISWSTSESELTTASVLATLAWLVLGLGAATLLPGAASWAAWSRLHWRALALVGVPVAAGVVGFLFLVYALRLVGELPD